MSAYVSQSGEKEAAGGERASGGRSVARLAGLDRLSPSLPQWHFVTLSLLALSISLYQLRLVFIISTFILPYYAHFT